MYFTVAWAIEIFTCTKKNIIVDNPTSTNVTINIDDKDYTLGQNSSKEIELKKGPHHFIVKANNSNVLMDKKKLLQAFIKFSINNKMISR